MVSMDQLFKMSSEVESMPICRHVGTLSQDLAQDLDSHGKKQRNLFGHDFKRYIVLLISTNDEKSFSYHVLTLPIQYQ